MFIDKISNFFFEIIKFFNIFSKVERNRIKFHFKKRVVWAPLYIFLVYAFLSYTDYINSQSWDDIDIMIDYLWPSSWHKDVWDVDTFFHFLSVSIVFSLLYIISNIFIGLYEFTKENWYVIVNTIFFVLLDLNITYFDLFLYYAEKNHYAMGVLYFHFFWVYNGLQWYVDMDEDFEFEKEQEDKVKPMYTNYADEEEELDELEEVWQREGTTLRFFRYMANAYVSAVPDGLSTLSQRYNDHKIKMKMMKAEDANFKEEEFVDEVYRMPKVYTEWEKTKIALDDTMDDLAIYWMRASIVFAHIPALFKGKITLGDIFHSLKVYLRIVDIKYAIISFFRIFANLGLKFRIAYHFIRRILYTVVFWIYAKLIIRIISYIRTLYLFIKLLVVNMFRRNSRVYVVGPYNFYDPFYSKSLLKKKQEAKTKIKLKTWILGQRYYGIQNNSKWNLNQKKFSLKMFKKNKKEN